MNKYILSIEFSDPNEVAKALAALNSASGMKTVTKSAGKKTSAPAASDDLEEGDDLTMDDLEDGDDLGADEEVTAETLTAKVAELKKAGKLDKVKALFSKLGYAGVSKVPKEKYEKVLELLNTKIK